MKKRYGIGVGAILAIGFLLGQFFKLPGFGGGSTGDAVLTSNSEPDETSQAETESEASDDIDALRNVSVTNNVRPSRAPTELVLPPEAFITIAVDGGTYRLTTPIDPSEGMKLSLGEVVAQASQTTGGESGVRVRILFHKNAQEGAISDLRKALDSAGIKREEIQEISGYID